MALFTPADIEAIRDAVRRAEGQTSGEIVPYVVGRSASPEPVLWRGAFAGLVVGALSVWLIRMLVAGWSMPLLHSAWTVHAFMAVGAAAGLVLVRFVPAAFRLIAGRSWLDRVAHERALRAFVDDEVFDTRDRTGIVLLVSMQERRVVVLGDAGINARVAEEDWTDVVDIVRNGLRSGRPAEALVHAIERCGEILREKGVEIRPDDVDEISDRPRIDPGL